MPLKRYGVLKKRAIDRRLGEGESPHYQMHIVDKGNDLNKVIDHYIQRAMANQNALVYAFDERRERNISRTRPSASSPAIISTIPHEPTQPREDNEQLASPKAMSQ